MKILNTCIFVLFSLFICVSAFLSPMYNWDVLGYTASALSYETKSPEAIHRKTYSLAQEKIPPTFFDKIVSNNDPLRIRSASDPNFFYNQLFAFKVKPLYILSMFLFSKMGIHLIQASYLMSIISVGLLCFLIFTWISQYARGSSAGLFAVLVALAVRLPYLARLSTPDAFSAAVIVGAFYVLLEKKQIRLSCVLFLLSILIRLDNIIVALLVFGYLGFGAPKSFAIKKSGSLGLLLSALLIGLGGVVSAKTGYWRPICHNVLLGLNTDIYGPVVFSFKEYGISFFLGLIRPMWDISFASHTYVFVCLGLLFCLFRANKQAGRQPEIDILIINLISIGVHFVFYPQLIDRLFVSHYLLIIFMCLKCLHVNRH